MTLNKKQALAAMDAHLIRVEAETTRRLERRFGHSRVLYPALREVPLQSIEGLMDEAGRHMRRQWAFYLAIIVIVALVALALFRPLLGLRRSIGPSFPWYLVAMGAMWFVRYLHIRAFLKRRVPMYLRTSVRGVGDAERK
jgi:hypothetical protein